MKYFLIFFIFLGSINFLFAAEESSKKIELPDNFVSGDSERGSQLVESCSACHGTDGNSISSDWPKLAGQNQKYLYEQLQYFILSDVTILRFYRKGCIFQGNFKSLKKEA